MWLKYLIFYLKKICSGNDMCPEHAQTINTLRLAWNTLA